MVKVIEVSGLTKMFGSFTAVDHISFDVKEESLVSWARTARARTLPCRCCAVLACHSGEGTVAGYDILKTS